MGTRLFRWLSFASLVAGLLFPGLQATPAAARPASQPSLLAEMAAPVQPAAPEVAAMAVAAGREHTCALTRGGGVKCWGHNNYGQLGDNTLIDKTSPVTVVGLESGVTAVAAGGYHTCALLDTGGLKCWGRNDEGQLGDSSNTDRPAPVSVTGLGSGVTTVTSGDKHTCARTDAGGIKCWGRNVEGQLGNGTNDSRNVPGDVFGMTTGMLQVDAGIQHTCASTSGGAVRCWGKNNVGQLGNDTTDDSNVPVNVSGLAGVSGLDVGGYHACALVSGGAKCWGYNSYGQLGDNSTQDRWMPVDVPALTSGVSVISTGLFHTCAQLSTGGLMCWGQNNAGQIGDGSTTNRLEPVNVFAQALGVTAVSTGGSHTCALTGAGVRCWGLNLYGQLGNGNTTNQQIPTDVIGLGNRISKVVTGEYHSCALTDAGWLKCWGRNNKGQLGDGTLADKLTPVDVYDLGSGVISVDAAAGHTCAVMSGGGVKCWGDNAWGQLGDGTTTDRLLPVDVVGLSGVKAVALGSAHTCALTTGGGVKCWGYNGSGQLGDGTFTHSRAPVDVYNLISGVGAIAAFTWHSCALTSIGGVKCWGFNGAGQLGDNSTNTSNKPVDVVSLGDGAGAIAAGGQHSCALTTGGGARCWGQNTEGQLGDTTLNNSSIPVDVFGLGSGLKAIAAGGNHSCALTNAGAGKCWGLNDNGQLGDGTNALSAQPVDVSGLSTGAQAIATGASHTCAVIGGGVKCWGLNDNGQLGDDTQTAISVPVNVTGLPVAPFVAGRITDLTVSMAAPAAGLPGVTVSTDAGLNAKSGADGSYTFYELASGEHTLTPSLDGYVFVPASRTVTLGDADLGGQDFSAYRVIQADFDANPTSGTFPLTVAFTNTSSGDYTASLWDFGDGLTSTQTSPAHTYTAAGTYTVTLTASGPGGSDKETKPNLVSVYTPVSAGFSAAPTTGAAPLTVVFTNTSTGSYTASSWIFGDGQTSTEPSPSHSYTQPGFYTVTLTVSGPGGSDSETKPAYISVYNQVQADFTGSPREGVGQATVVFTNTSSGDYTTSQWAFGDGQTSAQQNPTHNYAQPGSYTVTLTASGPGGSDSETKAAYITIYRPVQADFTGLPREGIGQATVTFTNTSSGDYTTSQWAFGDGGTSTLKNPTHKYTQPGSYTATLTVGGLGGSDTEIKSEYIAVYAPVAAAFNAAPTSGPAGLTVVFTNTSAGSYTISQWAFGDGGSSAQKNPTHIYSQPGVYTVTLTVSGGGGMDTETKTNYITVYTPVAADFEAAPTEGKAPLTVVFTNTSTGNYTSSEWTFGDEQTSSETNPTHTYTAAGTYTVTLTVRGPGGTDVETKSGYIVVSAGEYKLYLPLVRRDK